MPPGSFSCSPVDLWDISQNLHKIPKFINDDQKEVANDPFIDEQHAADGHWTGGTPHRGDHSGLP